MASRSFIDCSALVIIASLLQALPSSAETTANLVQQLYADHFEGRERWVCFRTADTNRPVTIHQWRRPAQGETELLLVVYSEDAELLDDCTLGAFESLRNAAFLMQIEPPKVKLVHYVTTSSSAIVSQSRRDYRCSVPSQLRDHRTDVNYDTAYDLGSLQNLCQSR